MGYYQGDFYRGDPGFLSFLGGALKTVGGFIPGVGGIVSNIGEKIGAAGAKKATTAIVKAGETSLLKRAGAGAKQIIAKHPVLSAAGAAGAVGLAAGAAGSRLLRGRSGGGGHRRMNPCNVKALRRAIRRAHGFERIAKKVMRFSSPHKHKKFAGFKRARKRS
jgi:hypothetical protein